jgi:hypothetical protein
MNFPIHDYPHDYWRFTPEAFKSLLAPFKSSLVGFAGKSNFPHTVIGIGLKDSILENTMSELARKLKDWEKYWRNFEQLKEYWCNPQKSIWKGFIGLIAPPIFLTIYRKIRKIPS